MLYEVITRATAFPMDFPAATPIRMESEALGSNIKTTNGWAMALPKRRTRWKSEDFFRRNLLFTNHNSIQDGSGVQAASYNFV